MSAQTAKIEAGAVHLPRHAQWLDDLRFRVAQKWGTEPSKTIIQK
jgi:hypothetical protein